MLSPQFIHPVRHCHCWREKDAPQCFAVVEQNLRSSAMSSICRSAGSVSIIMLGSTLMPMMVSRAPHVCLCSLWGMPNSPQSQSSLTCCSSSSLLYFFVPYEIFILVNPKRVIAVCPKVWNEFDVLGNPGDK